MKTFGSWNLTNPLLKTVPTKDLSGYVDAFYYPEGEWQVFRAPSHGDGITHTKNSTYPRSELRQTLANGDDKEANWSPTLPGLFVLEGECRIDSLPKSGKLIWSQWHGESNHPPMKGNATTKNGKIQLLAQLRPKLNGSEVKPVVYDDYKLGTPFRYRWELEAGRLDLYIDGVKVLAGFQFDLDSYADDTWYAKLGCYSQQVIDADDTSLGEGRVAHRNYVQYHDDLAVEVPQPPETHITLDSRLTELADSVRAAHKAAQVTLNAISADIKAVSDAAERTRLNALARAIKDSIS
jgi:hypothetical protein